MSHERKYIKKTLKKSSNSYASEHALGYELDTSECTYPRTLLHNIIQMFTQSIQTILTKNTHLLPIKSRQTAKQKHTVADNTFIWAS